MWQPEIPKGAENARSQTASLACWTPKPNSRQSGRKGSSGRLDGCLSRGLRPVYFAAVARKPKEGLMRTITLHGGPLNGQAYKLQDPFAMGGEPSVILVPLNRRSGSP